MGFETIQIVAATDGVVGGDGALLFGTLVGTALITASVVLVYRFGWRDRPDPSFESSSAASSTGTARLRRRGGPMYESDVAESEMESVDHDEFDPVGTAALIALYFVVVALAWLFMYFVEFLPNGPTVVG
jgi:hypothetical protein